MKILVVSDEENSYIWDYFDRSRFQDIDLMISCGDLKAEYLSFLVTMIKAPLFYVHGNHDERYKTNPPEGCINIDDKLVKYKGLRLLGLGGSYRYRDGDFQYTEHQMKRRINKMRPKLWINKGFDILVTHAPAYKLGDGDDICHMGFKCFVDLIHKYSPKYLLHGHQHLSYTRNSRIIEYMNTKIINGFGYYIFEF
ncbi:MAG: metallophosphoesterase [Bacillota bacterium]|nr:metallophosphoesterase [Bacillota bacterium]